MSTLTLEAQIREAKGTQAIKQEVRRHQRVPAVIYGGKKEQCLITLCAFALDKVAETPEFLHEPITLEMNGKKEKVKVQEVQWQPSGIRLHHIDFIRI